MAQTQRLELRQSQKLALTPQLQQSLKLLQFSALELSDFVAQELETNPLLTSEEADRDETPQAESKQHESEQEIDRPREMDKDWEYEGAEPVIVPRGDAVGGGEGWDMEQTVSGEQSLQEYIMEQIQLEIAEPSERVIALQLLEAIDSAGYLTLPLEEIAAELNCDVAKVEEVLAKVQAMDPPGMFARTMAECLALQLQAKDRLDPYMERLLEHLDVLAEQDFARLAKICDTSQDEVRDMVLEIRNLDPKPGTAFETISLQAIQPDILVKRGEKGEWRIELNHEVLPKVLLDRTYYTEVNSASQDKETKQYISEHYRQANWLIKSLNQRAETMLRVAKAIIEKQEAFLEQGIIHLQPLTMRQLADQLELHESTVGRVVANKYMMTPRGLFPLKYFFSSGVGGGAGGEDVSSKTIKHLLKEMIDGESPKKILSDDTLAAMLKGQGYDVARRTVAKYREAMGIGSSVERRKLKRNLSTSS